MERRGSLRHAVPCAVRGRLYTRLPVTMTVRRPPRSELVRRVYSRSLLSRARHLAIANALRHARQVQKFMSLDRRAGHLAVRMVFQELLDFTCGVGLQDREARHPGSVVPNVGERNAQVDD